MKYFFYGSLKRGLQLNVLLNGQPDCDYIQDGATQPKFQLWNFVAYPGMTFGQNVVNGEIWEINNPDVQEYLDDMEKAAGYTPQHIILQDGTVVKCFIMKWDTAEKHMRGTKVDEWPVKAQSKPHESHEAHQEGPDASHSPEAP